jgi:hypothetical protein
MADEGGLRVFVGSGALRLVRQHTCFCPAMADDRIMLAFESFGIWGFRASLRAQTRVQQWLTTGGCCSCGAWGSESSLTAHALVQQWLTTARCWR